MNKKQALAMLAFISDLYSIIQDTNAKEAVDAAQQAASNGQATAEAARAAQPLTVD